MSLVRPRPIPVIAIIALTLLAFALVALASPSSPLPAAPVAGAAVISKGDPKDCDDFKSQKKAQKWFKKHNPGRDPAGLDADNDGIACEENPCPCSSKRTTKYPIGAAEALDKTSTYARVVCSNHGTCQSWAAGQCQRHDDGISCKAHVFLRRNSGRKVECVRLVWYTAKGGPIHRDFLGNWECYKGWSGFGSD